MSYYRQGPFRPGGGGVQLGLPGVTPLVRILIGVNVGVWLVQLLMRAMGLPIEQWLGLVPALVVRGFLWQLGTYMFLHSPVSIFHLLFNMLMLWMFGGELERYWGSKAFLRYYLVCGVGAGVFATVMGFLPIGNPVSITYGASGAIFGLFIAFGIIFAERTILFMLIFPMKARTMAIIMFAVTFFYTVTQPQSGVSHVAHLGGAIVGFLYLKRAWRVGEFVRDLRWKAKRRRFRVMPPDDRDDFDRWVN